MMARPDPLRERLGHVVWIGGASGAGKSSIARRIAVRRGLGLYSTDEAMADHAGRSRPEDSPLLQAFKAMDMDERWLNRTPQAMFETFHWFAGEGFQLILQDLLAPPPRDPVVAEGFRLLPRLVEPLLSDRRRAVWLIPTPEFRRAAFESRGELWTIAGRTSDPGRALDNLLRRDAMFAEVVARDARALGLAVLEVDGRIPEAELAEQVEKRLDLD